MKILIAEDDLTSCAVLTAVLEEGGHEVVVATNGIEAWQVLQQPHAPRLVILDWAMPGMDGPEVLRRLRSLPTDCPPYVIMVTARGGNLNIVAGLKAGANDYMTKPVEPDEILARVEAGQRIIEMELLNHRRRERAQILRVESSLHITALRDALAAKDAELRRTQDALSALEARLQIPCWGDLRLLSEPRHRKSAHSRRKARTE